MIKHVLLDECVPQKLGGYLSPHVVSTVRQQGWDGIANGQLLRAAEAAFDVFLTADKGIPNQQTVASLRLAVVVVRPRRNMLSFLVPLIPKIMAAVEHATPGTLTVVAAPAPEV